MESKRAKADIQAQLDKVSSQSDIDAQLAALKANGTTTELPMGTVMSRLSRARQQLQRRLASCVGEDGK